MYDIEINKKLINYYPTPFLPPNPILSHIYQPLAVVAGGPCLAARPHVRCVGGSQAQAQLSLWVYLCNDDLWVIPIYNLQLV